MKNAYEKANAQERRNEVRKQLAEQKREEMSFEKQKRAEGKREQMQ